MSVPYVDTDPIVRLLTGDDPVKQEAVYQLFRQVRDGQLALAAPISVIADAVYVLSSPRTYRLSRQQVAGALVPLVQLPGFHVDQKQILLRAFDVYVETSIDFSDAIIVASMERADAHTLFTYDRHFDGVSRIQRIEPGQSDVEPNGRQP